MFWSEFDEYEERESRLATPAEAIAEFAWNAGEEVPDQAWLSHDWDVWVKNPHYVGPPVPHPESDDAYDAEDAENLAAELSDKATRRAISPEDDDIPF
jgi:hypothetical protein